MKNFIDNVIVRILLTTTFLLSVSLFIAEPMLGVGMLIMSIIVELQDDSRHYNKDGTPKVGTKIHILSAGHGAMGCDGHIGIVTDEESNDGLFELENGYNVKLVKNGRVWRINKDAEIKILNKWRIK